MELQSQTRLSDFASSSSIYHELLFILNWSMAALQCCVSFHRTTKQISHMYTYIPSLLEFPPTPSPVPFTTGHHRALSGAPCIAQQVLTSCLFLHVVEYISQSQSFQFIAPPFPSACPFSIASSLSPPCQ